MRIAREASLERIFKDYERRLTALERATINPGVITGGGEGFTRYVATIGNGSDTSFSLTHGRSTQNIIVEVFRNSSPHDKVYPDVKHDNSSQVTISFASPPSTNQFIVVVI